MAVCDNVSVNVVVSIYFILIAKFYPCVVFVLYLPEPKTPKPKPVYGIINRKMKLFLYSVILFFLYKALRMGELKGGCSKSVSWGKYYW